MSKDASHILYSQLCPLPTGHRLRSLPFRTKPLASFVFIMPVYVIFAVVCSVLSVSDVQNLGVYLVLLCSVEICQFVTTGATVFAAHRLRVSEETRIEATKHNFLH